MAFSELSEASCTGHPERKSPVGALVTKCYRLERPETRGVRRIPLKMTSERRRRISVALVGPACIVHEERCQPRGEATWRRFLPFRRHAALWDWASACAPVARKGRTGSDRYDAQHLASSAADTESILCTMSCHGRRRHESPRGRRAVPWSLVTDFSGVVRVCVCFGKSSC
jgi:hypothetical protein